MSEIKELLERIRALSPEDWRKLQVALDETRTSDEPKPNLTEDEFERDLAKRGMISIPAQPRGSARTRKVVPISGKPLSETVVEERR